MRGAANRVASDPQRPQSESHGHGPSCSSSCSCPPSLSRSLPYLALPAGALFLGLAKAKELFYRQGLLRKTALPAPAISVGNLTFGGTGKTPFTIHLAGLAQARGLRPAVVLRGYGRRTKGARLVTAESTAAEVGDEALLYARSLPRVPVAVAERREEAAGLFSAPPGLFILDDAFQHQRVRRDADILLVDASRPGDLWPPPVGRLRECASAASRADLLVVTRGAFLDLPARLRTRWGGRPHLEVRFRWAEGLGPAGDPPLAALRSIPTVAFAGIGTPGPFFEQARTAGVDIRAEVPFPDHAEPTPQRIELLRTVLRVAEAKALLTTEKDAVKWLPAWKEETPLYFARLEAEVEDPEDFLGALLDRLRGPLP